MVKRQSVLPRWLLLTWSAFLLCVTEAAFAEESQAERRGLIFVREYCSQCHAIGKPAGVALRMRPHFAHCVSDIQLQTCSDLCLREFIRRCRDFSSRLVR